MDFKNKFHFPGKKLFFFLSSKILIFRFKNYNSKLNFKKNLFMVYQFVPQKNMPFKDQSEE
jgi:hypothetical protein